VPSWLALQVVRGLVALRVVSAGVAVPRVRVAALARSQMPLLLRRIALAQYWQSAVSPLPGRLGVSSGGWGATAAASARAGTGIG
jgi:hypothetical protein